MKQEIWKNRMDIVMAEKNTADIGFEKQIWNAAEEIVLKELVYIESVESSFGSFLLFIR